MKNASRSTGAEGRKARGKGKSGGQQTGRREENQAEQKSLRRIPTIKTSIEEGEQPTEATQESRKREDQDTGLPRRHREGRDPLVLFNQERRKGGWVPVSWPNANKCRISEAGATGLRVRCQEGKKPKGGIRFPCVSPVNSLPYDSFRVRAKVLDLSGAQEEVEVALGVETDSYYESPSVVLEPGGQSTVEIELQKKHFKAPPEWEYSTSLQNRQEVRNVYLLFYYAGECSLEVSRMRFTEKKRAEKKDNDDRVEEVGRKKR